MRPWIREILLVVAAFAAGAWAWRLSGEPPAPPPPGETGTEIWALPPAAGPNLRLADSLWLEKAPLGLPPEPPPPPSPPPPPPQPRPVGIIATPRGPSAVFVTPGGGEFTVRRGEKLPGGGRLVSITRFRITWIDRDGKRREHELLGDPPASLVP